MTYLPNTLPEQFPDAAQQMHLLKISDPHFARLARVYDDLNSAIHRAESNIEPTDDLHMVHMRKSRLSLLDEISAYLL